MVKKLYLEHSLEQYENMKIRLLCNTGEINMNKNRMLTIRINEMKIKIFDEIRKRNGENSPRGDLIRQLIDEYIKNNQKCSGNARIIPKTGLKII